MPTNIQEDALPVDSRFAQGYGTRYLCKVRPNALSDFPRRKNTLHYADRLSVQPMYPVTVQRGTILPYKAKRALGVASIHYLLARLLRIMVLYDKPVLVVPVARCSLRREPSCITLIMRGRGMPWSWHATSGIFSAGNGFRVAAPPPLS